MNHLIPFTFENQDIRIITDDIGNYWFVATDVCEVLTIENHRNVIARLDPDEKGVHTMDTNGGKQTLRTINESGLYSLILSSRKPEAKKFVKWMTSEVLPSIRKTGAYQIKEDQPNRATSQEAFKLIPLAVRAARSCGLDKNAAVISANQYVHKLTHVNLLKEFGHTHLKAENQDCLYFTPTQLGQRIGVSGKQFNLLLVMAGLQFKQDGQWHLTESGEPFGRIYDTGKHHQSGTPVAQTKWTDAVLALVKQQVYA